MVRLLMPQWLTILVDIAAWGFFHAATGYAAYRLGDARLSRDGWLLRPRRFESGRAARVTYHVRMNRENPDALPVIHLKTERRSTHPWIFQKMVEKPAVRPKPGSVVDIIDREGNFAGRGFYNGHSRIALRVLTADPGEAIDEAFFARKIGEAVSLRRDLLRLDAATDAYRLVHSEGDGLSGLVVDR